jgi:hypothetical protein
VHRLKCHSYGVVGGLIVFLAVMAQGQTRMASVNVKASVSETVALSVSANFSQDNFQISHADTKALTLTLSGSGPNVMAVRVPMLIRSNSSYAISALVQSRAVNFSNFAVLEARPTGRFVASDAIANLNVGRGLDPRPTLGTIQTDLLHLNLSYPFPILSGPRVSLSGTLNSPDNALEVILLITVKPDDGADNWLLRLTLSGASSDRF